MIPIPYNLFQKTEAEETLSNLFYEATITLISEPYKDITRKENYRPKFLMNIDANTVLAN